MKIRLTHPLISCICITDNRPSMLMKAIFSFDTQNYPIRELVISYPEDDKTTEEVVEKISATSAVKIVPLKRKRSFSLGKARNHAVENCNGDYICVWDDDDIYYSNRIAHQYNTMQGKYYEAGIISNVMMYDTMTQNAYHSMSDNWPGTLLCRKDLVLKYPYTDSDINESDYLIQSLDSRKLLYKIDNAAYIYGFVYHQENKTDYANFLNSLYKSQMLNGANRDYLRDQFNLKLTLA